MKSKTAHDRPQPGPALYVDLADLGTRRLSVKGSLAPGELDLSKHGIRQIGPLRWTGFIERQGAEFRFSGRVETDLEVDCVRCLDPVPERVRKEFDLFFQQRESLIYEVDDDIELKERDTQTSFLTGTVLPLGEIVEEQVLLALSMKPLCVDECRGLCPDCGVNRNRERCECSTQYINPAFRDLTALKQRLEDHR